MNSDQSGAVFNRLSPEGTVSLSFVRTFFPEFTANSETKSNYGVLHALFPRLVTVTPFCFDFGSAHNVVHCDRPDAIHATNKWTTLP